MEMVLMFIAKEFKQLSNSINISTKQPFNATRMNFTYRVQVNIDLMAYIQHNEREFER